MSDISDKSDHNAYQQPIESEPNDAEYYATLGGLYIDQSRYDDAINVFKKAIILNPKQANYQRRLGYAYSQKGLYNEATAAYQQAISLNREQATYHFALGNTYLKRHKYDEATTAYQQAQNLAQTQDEQVLKAKVWRQLGLAWLRRAELDNNQRTIYLIEATRTFEQAFNLLSTLEPNSLYLARLHHDIGRCYAWQGRWQAAMEHLVRARQMFIEYKIKPDLARTLLELGQLFHQYQESEDAYAHLKDALRLFQKLDDKLGQAATQEALGNLLLQMGQVVEATVYLQTARQYYATFKQTQRLQGVDELLDIAAEAQQKALTQELIK